MSTMKSLLSVVLLTSVFALPSYAAVVDNAAAVVKLRDPNQLGCTDGGTPLNNCFTDSTALNNWITATRKPSASKPLLVEIGPGVHGQIFCNTATATTGLSHISYRGSGMRKTRVASYANYDCDQITVSDLTITGYANTLVGGKKTFWHDVQIASWTEYENASCGLVKGEHYWFSSQILGTYSANCDKSWFYGSELANTVTPDVGSGVVTLEVKGSGEVSVYGSNISAKFDGALPTLPGPAVAVKVSNGGTVHIHGTGIDAIHTGGGAVVALQASSGGTIHANSSAYNLVGGTAPGYTKVRIDNQGGHVHAPYLWEEHPQPPSSINIGADGADMAIETTSGGVMNLLVNRSSCTGAGGPWYNLVTRACR